MLRLQLIPNPAKDKGYKYTKEVLSVLSRYDCEIYLPSETRIPETNKVHYLPCNEKIDFLIVLGGDGSIMKASHMSAKMGVPILGINLGRVGYMAEVEPLDLNQLSEIFDGNYSVEKRMMLKVCHMRNGKCLSSAVALNDAVISHGRTLKLVDTELFCDGSSLGRYRSDGFIVSTPTGSTAYSLSAGGPILAPNLRAINLVPICSYSMTSRPIIVPDSSVVELKYMSNENAEAYLTVDGSESYRLLDSDTVKISVSELTAYFIRIKNGPHKNFYKILREKLSEF